MEYDLFADIYDNDLGTVKEDLEMYQKYCNDAKKILVLSCGTGREISAIKTDINYIVGLDISVQMLKQAELKFKNNLNKDIILKKGDMKNFEFSELFDLILIPNSGILHLLSLDDIEACLKCCKNNLSQNGKIVLDFFLPDYPSLSINNSGLLHDFTKREEGKWITRTRIHKRDLFFKTNKTQIFYELIYDDGRTEKRVCEYTFRYLFKEEIELLFRIINLHILECFGNFDRTPFSRNSNNIIYCLK